jgi:inner membrane protein
LKHPLFAKIAALAAVGMLLLFGLSQIENVVFDRQVHRSAAAHSVAQSLAGPQTLLGPLVHSACVESWDETVGTGAERRTEERRREFLLTAPPERLQVQSAALMQERARGLHKVNAYTLKAHLTAQWPDLAALRPEGTVRGSRMQCGAPILMLAVQDARGIRAAQVDVDGSAQVLRPGTFHPVYARGLHTALSEGLRHREGVLTAALDLELVGTERLAIVPLGGTTEVQMQSTWPHPSFAGRFLPSEREVGDGGFTARWRLSSLATTAQQDIIKGRAVCDVLDDGGDRCADSFSVAFVDPVNPYTLSDRATKYGVLFIALTFVLCSFFLLLVSLSEHLPFGLSYALAAGACVLLLGYYASHMLGGRWRGVPFGAGIALLYGLLYVLLQLEQTALVVGAVALFAVLAAVMVLTRKVDWYGLAARRMPAQEVAA